MKINFKKPFFMIAFSYLLYLIYERHLFIKENFLLDNKDISEILDDKINDGIEFMDDHVIKDDDILKFIMNDNLFKTKTIHHKCDSKCLLCNNDSDLEINGKKIHVSSLVFKNKKTHIITQKK